MPDYEAKIGISVDTSELDDAEKRINDLVKNKQTIKIDTSGSVKSIDGISDSVKNAQKNTSSFGDMFKKALGIGTTATLAAKAIRLIGKAAKEAFNNVKVLDKSMTELRKVTDETPQTYKKILSDASTTAREIGTSINGLIDSTADFARLGYSIGDSQQLAKTANIYAQIGDGVSSVDAATKSIISTMSAFKIGASDSIKIVDKFNEVGNKYAISSGGIGAALERSASSMAAAGNSLDQSIALITAANTVVQNPESIGTAFKTITMRIRGAKTELEDAGLSTEGMATSVSKLRDEIRALSGVDIMQNDSTFKSTYQIMDELSQKWKELSDIQKASITELIAGKRQGNIVSSLMENFDIARNALNSSLNSDGSAMAEHAKWLDSIEAKTNQLKAAFESLSINTISSEIVGGIVQATTGIVTLLDKTNLVKTSLAGLVAFGGIKGFTAITTGITNAAIAMDKFNTALTISKSANIGKSQIEQLVQITTTLSASQTNAIITAKALSTEQRMAILTARGMSQAEAEAALASMGLSTAEGAATASTLSLKGAFQGLMATLKPFAPLLIGAAAAFATFKTMQYYSFDGFYKRATKDQEALEATKNTLAETASAIENNKAKIEELRSQRSSGTGGSVSDINSEIKRLEQENAILEQKKKIYEENQKIEQQKAAESAGRALTQTDLYDTQVFNEETGVYESQPEKRTILDNVQADIAKAKELQTALDNNAKSIANIDTSTKEGQNQFRLLSEQRSRLQAALAETQTSVNQQKESILDLYSALFDSDGNIISGYEGLVDQIQGIFPELVTSAENTGTAIATAFDSATASIDENVTSTKNIVESIGKVQELVAKQKAGATLSPEDLNADGIREYAKALEYTNGVYQLNAEKVRELVKSKADKDKVDWIEIAIKRFEALLKKLSNIAENTFNNLITRLNATNENITATRKDIDFQSKAYDRYIEEANKVGLKEDIAEKVRNGDLDINSYDEKTRDKITQYQKWYEKAEDCAEAIEDLKTSLAELYKSKFDNVQKDFENKLSLMEERAAKFDTELKRLEAKGYTANASIYESQRKDKQNRITTLTAQLAEMQKAFDDTVASGFLQEGNEAWYEMMLEIQKVKNEIAETDVEIIELNNSIRELQWDSFDKALESISDLNDEADFLISVLSGEKLTDEAGNLTSEGMAALGLRAQKIDTYMAQSQRYADEIARLDKEISEDPLNNTLIERRKELLKLQRESITAAQDEKEAMKDLVSEGIDAQLNSIKELIDAYNDSLDSAKDLYDYQKSITEKTKTISDIEKQLAAYQGDNSQETRARLQKLRSDLKEAEQDLQDTEYDRFISDTKELLDDFYSDYEETLQKQLENTDKLIEELIQSVNGNSSSILSTLQDVTKEVGIGLSQEITDIWTNSGSAWNVVSSGADKVADKVSSVFEVARAIYKNTCLIAGESATMSFASGG